ncbi:DgyrCDS14760 [Dimorphilus gyrociliatus]|uniref:DgyrCDS14760 n=1 Tax=Dimorphilus gyrociliatus TaxID=2664684 RepID=A0A7I8WEW5_9ANNE|nr:DgyrCDS14760 [Dimorphilus gyrociliatus]
MMIPHFLYIFPNLLLCIHQATQANLLNLARGKLSFQSSTYGGVTAPMEPGFAIDSNVGVLLTNENNNCSRTSKHSSEKSWWSVDLEQIYSITEVCLLNVNDNIYDRLQQFHILLGKFPNNENSICKFVTDPVKRPTSTDSSQYSCYSCNPDSIGSFLTIRLIAVDIELILCDVNVRGKLINDKRETPHSFKHYITQATLNDVSLSTNQLDLLKDDVYYINDNDGQISLASNDVLVLTTKLVHINSLCLRVFHGTNSKPGILIKITNFLTGTITSKEIPGDFKHSHTVCVQFGFLLTKNIKIESPDSRGLAEVDLIAVSSLTQKS